MLFNQISVRFGPNNRKFGKNTEIRLKTRKFRSETLISMQISAPEKGKPEKKRNGEIDMYAQMGKGYYFISKRDHARHVHPVKQTMITI